MYDGPAPAHMEESPVKLDAVSKGEPQSPALVAETPKDTGEMLRLVESKNMPMLKEALDSAKSIDQQVLAELIRNHLSHLIPELEKFGMKGDIETARFFLRQENGIYALNNLLDRFQGLDTGIANVLLDHGLEKMFIKHVSAFVNLDEGVAQRLEKLGYGDHLFSHRKNFVFSNEQSSKIYQDWFAKSISPKESGVYF